MGTDFDYRRKTTAPSSSTLTGTYYRNYGNYSTPYASLPGTTSGSSAEEIADALYEAFTILFGTDEKKVFEQLRLLGRYNSSLYTATSRVYALKYSKKRSNRSLIEDIVHELLDDVDDLRKAFQILDYDITSLLLQYIENPGFWGQADSIKLMRAMRDSEMRMLPFEKRVLLLKVIIQVYGHGTGAAAFISEHVLKLRTLMSNEDEKLVTRIINAFPDREKFILYNRVMTDSYANVLEFLEEAAATGTFPGPETKRPGPTRDQEEHWKSLFLAINNNNVVDPHNLDSENRKYYLNTFRDIAVHYMHNLLNLSEDAASTEGIRYTLMSEDEAKELHDSLAGFRKIWKKKRNIETGELRDLEAEKARSENVEGQMFRNVAREMEVLKGIVELRKQIRALNDEATGELRAQSRRYPVLANEEINRYKLAEADQEKLAGLLVKNTIQTLDSINKVRDKLTGSPDILWEAELVIQYTMQRLGVPADSFMGTILGNKLKDMEQFRFWRNLIIAAVSLGLGIASLLLGGIPGVILGVIGSGVGLAGSIIEYREFMDIDALDKSGFSAELELTEKGADSSILVWLLLDLLGFVGDAAAAVKAFRSLKPAVSAVKLGSMADTDFVKVVEGISEIKNAPNAGQLGGPGKYAEKVLKRIAGETENIQAGLRQLRNSDPGQYSKLVDMFGEGTTDMQRIGELIFKKGAQDFSEFFDALHRGLGRDKLEKLFRFYMHKVNVTEMADLFTIAQKSGLDAGDIAAMNRAMADSASPKDIAGIFRRHIRAKVIKHIQEIKSLDELRTFAKEVHPKTAGNLFEELVLEIDPAGAVRGRQIKHPGTKQVSRPDLLYEIDNGWKLGETKFSSTLEGKKFTRSSREYERLQKYAALIEDGVVYQGKRIRRIKIVFSSEEFAKVNQDDIKRLFRENVDIFYITDNLTEVKL